MGENRLPPDPEVLKVTLFEPGRDGCAPLSCRMQADTPAKNCDLCRQRLTHRNRPFPGLTVCVRCGLILHLACYTEHLITAPGTPVICRRCRS